MLLAARYAPRPPAVAMIQPKRSMQPSTGIPNVREVEPRVNGTALG